MRGHYTPWRKLELEIIDAAAAFNCTINMLTGGDIKIHVNTTVSTYRSNNPAWFIKCMNQANYTLLTKSLEHISLQDNLFKNYRDSFLGSAVMYGSSLPAACTIAWIMVLVLALLPAKSHYANRGPVFIYTLSYAIGLTLFATHLTRNVFQKQYQLNYQNISEVALKINKHMILKFNLYLNSILANLAWLQVVYHMFHNYRQSKRRWIPYWLKNHSTRILFIGIPLSIADAIVGGINLFWSPSNVAEGERRLISKYEASYYLHVFIEFLIFVLFTISIYYHVYQFFIQTIDYVQQREDDNETQSKWATLKDTYSAYKYTIPILLHNTLAFAFFAIGITVNFFKYNGMFYWCFIVTSFFRVVITVSVWALLGILEKQEHILRKKTILGRKISDEDMLFVEPSSSLLGFNSGETVEVDQNQCSSKEIGHRERTTDNYNSNSGYSWFSRRVNIFKKNIGSFTADNYELQTKELHSFTILSDSNSVETELGRNIIFDDDTWYTDTFSSVDE
ncbi:HGR083Cp [Eremothecium sinecaudum]|uniref:HGR083Cp n=1 Tax=Eremothecium sinecaudum TaxID=45286 RepID=A0A0X8HVV3_9SACH|nr:HGR083Cp [Eremothecium sinecaudum]AMD22422.1 HGR083Cp [Eremothecium sinecaudum]